MQYIVGLIIIILIAYFGGKDLTPFGKFLAVNVSHLGAFTAGVLFMSNRKQ